MATTTNYSWATPDDTDLVKDGAAAIRTLGSSIDTTVFEGVTQAILNVQTGTTYTLVLADAGKTIDIANASPVTITVPPDSTADYEVGTRIDIVASGAGLVTVAEGAGVTINSKDGNKKLKAQWSGATLILRATNSWVLIGDLVA
jgi:hypothetical protein